MPTTPATAETDSVPMAKQAFYETKRFRQNIPLFLMLVPGILYYVIFRYFPMGGLVIAFKDYNFRDGILSSPWVGLKYFKLLQQPVQERNRRKRHRLYPKPARAESEDPAQKHRHENFRNRPSHRLQRLQLLHAYVQQNSRALAKGIPQADSRAAAV